MGTKIKLDGSTPSATGIQALLVTGVAGPVADEDPITIEALRPPRSKA